MNLFNQYKQIVFFDVETTGLSPYQNEIIELGACTVISKEDKYIVSDKISLIINVNKPLPPKIIEITNITDDMIKKGVHEESLFITMQTLVQPGTLLVAYNLPFDLSFFMALFKKYKSPVDVFDQVDYLDMLTVYRAKHEYPHKLDNAVEKYAVKVKNTHRALDDALATFELFKNMSEIHNLESFINVIGYKAKYPFKGTKLNKITYIPQ
ncbi:3'-5' exonuclease [Liberiplasma polymorphum]|uniref:3'-5' exonuclease n=1 Tax=Liberiplasma polymorphum TaxID=3374570 RepID=UPI003775F831